MLRAPALLQALRFRERGFRHTAVAGSASHPAHRSPVPPGFGTPRAGGTAGGRGGRWCPAAADLHGHVGAWVHAGRGRRLPAAQAVGVTLTPMCHAHAGPNAGTGWCPAASVGARSTPRPE